MLEALRTGQHATTGEAARVPAVLANLYSDFLSVKMTPVEMLDTLAVACISLADSVIDVFSGNRTDAAGQDTMISTAAPQDAQSCTTCNGHSVVKAETHDASRRYPDGRERHSGDRGVGDWRSRGRGDRGGEQGRRLSGNHFHGSYDKIIYSDWSDWRTQPPPRVSGVQWHWCDDHGH